VIDAPASPALVAARAPFRELCFGKVTQLPHAKVAKGAKD
jgi:hypothetical protein